MGGAESIPIVTIDFPGMCIYFSSSDKLTLLHSDQALINYIRMLLEKYWPQGIQRCQQSYGAIEYKLCGYPFQYTWFDTNSESLQAQIMCGYFLKELLTQGSTLVASSDLSRYSHLERTAWFFRRSTPIVLDQRYTNVPNFTVSKGDRLIFLHLNQQMQRELIALINTTYRKGVQEVLQLGPDGVRIKLNGYPWREKWNLENEARPLLLAVIQYFEQRGYYFYGNASLQGQTDTVYFMPLTLPWPLRINPPLEPASENRYFAIGLDRKDRLRLLNCPIVLDNIIEVTILQFWPKGIQDKKQIGYWFEYKMAGYPWCASGYETVEARLLLTQIFQNLHMHGWAIMAALDTSRSLDDTSFLIFRSTPSRSMHYMCLSLNEIDKIRLINAPSDVVKVVHDAIQTYYTYGIQRFENYGSVPEFKLNGSPWGGGNNYSKHGRQLLMLLMDCLVKLGFGFAISADVSAKYHSDGNNSSNNHKIDVHSWWFARPIL